MTYPLLYSKEAVFLRTDRKRKNFFKHAQIEHNNRDKYFVFDKNKDMNKIHVLYQIPLFNYSTVTLLAKLRG